ncbi:MAG: HlyD family efflux transporter periplasmic adaptor subunit [Betaproteobacteria bacterium]|nr:HlyD family efflux transporter periplasmic adaptor subunit [Betaproteobacteria bacterium]
MTEPATENKSTNIAAELLEYQRKLQACKSLRELAFVAVNEGFSVLRFDQAVIWQYDLRSEVSIEAVSGLAEVAPEAPYVQWLARAAVHFSESPGQPVVVSALADLPDALAEDGAEWAPDQLIHCALLNPEGAVLGGLLFARDEPFEEIDRAVAQWMSAATGFTLWAWRRDYRPVQRWLRRTSTKRLLLGAALAAALLSFVPVRLSALAQAEITPVRPYPITAPVEGVVDSIKVQPNQIVSADEPLVVLNDTTTRNKLAVAVKALDIAKADLQRAINKSFTDDQSKGELNLLDARVREKVAEVAFLSEMLDRYSISAPQGGLAIFADAEEWRGRPVQPGERIMVVADPSMVEVTVYVPPEDAVQLELGSEVSMFLNVDPLSPLKAKIVQTSYETITMPDNSLAYVVKAQLAPGALPRIGLRGTAKVYAEEVSLGYYLLRKPILFMRKSLGL